MSEKKLIVMSIGAHPADAIDLSGGTLYNHAQAGDRVIIVNMTHGAYSHAAMLYDEFRPKYSTEAEAYAEIIKIKEAEAVDGGKVLGAQEVINLGWDDEPLEETRERVWAVAEILRQYRPDIVITHHPNEFTHEDHSVCGWIVARALKAAGKFYAGSKFDRFFVPGVYFYGIQFLSKHARLGYVPRSHDILVDIEKAVEPKIKAMCALKSQKNTDNSIRRRINALEHENGRLDGLTYAEAFCLYNPLKMDTLPANRNASWYYLQDELMDKEAL